MEDEKIVEICDCDFDDVLIESDSNMKGGRPRAVRSAAAATTRWARGTVQRLEQKSPKRKANWRCAERRGVAGEERRRDGIATKRRKQEKGLSYSGAGAAGPQPTSTANSDQAKRCKGGLERKEKMANDGKKKEEGKRVVEVRGGGWQIVEGAMAQRRE